MMMNIRQKRLAVAVAGAVSLGASIAHAEVFNASATLQNTLAVTSLQDFDIGSVIASVTGGTLAAGVAALEISPLGVVSDPTDSSTVNMTSLVAPTAGQGSVDMAAQFTLTLPDTDSIAAANFPLGVAATKTNYAEAIELVHESANPIVPSLFLMHFTIGDVSGATTPEVQADNTGVFVVSPGFDETTYVFNIGATVTTEPLDFDDASVYPMTYQEGTYAGTFEITASY